MRLFRSRKSSDYINLPSVLPYQNDPQITIVSCNSHAFNSFNSNHIEHSSLTDLPKNHIVSSSSVELHQKMEFDQLSSSIMNIEKVKKLSSSSSALSTAIIKSKNESSPLSEYEISNIDFGITIPLKTKSFSDDSHLHLLRTKDDLSINALRSFTSSSLPNSICSNSIGSYQNAINNNTENNNNTKQNDENQMNSLTVFEDKLINENDSPVLLDIPNKSNLENLDITQPENQQDFLKHINVVVSQKLSSDQSMATMKEETRFEKIQPNTATVPLFGQNGNLFIVF